MDPLIRILDANANRAREGLRVLEDLARFALAREPLARAAKALRHDLERALAPLADPARRAASRDTESDVGTSITAPGEYTRRSPRDLALAAAARATEALRTLEETAKALPSSAHSPQAIEQIRYRTYTLERNLVLALSGARAHQWPLAVLITESLCTHHPWLEVARLAALGGAACLQLREKHLDAAELLRRARALVALARALPLPPAIIINDRPDVALLAQADGVHLGQSDLPCKEARAIFGDRLLIGVSTATLDQARAAARDGADYIGCGPMFESTTKPKPSLAGPAFLQSVRADPETARLPHLAISGITPTTARDLAALGCQGIAVSSAVCSARDPEHAARELVHAINGESRIASRQS